jgi:hypothetical protein
MDKALAKLLFQVPSDGDPQDVYDHLVFEHRNFFLSKSPIPTIFRARLAKAIQLQQAAFLEFPEEIDWDITEPNLQLIETEWAQNWLVDFGKLQVFRNQMKLHLHRLPHPTMWKDPIESWLDTEMTYAKLYGEDLSVDAEVLVSKEPDPMRIWQELTNLVFPSTPENLKFHSKDLSSTLQVEQKRLHLYTALIKKDGN